MELKTLNDIDPEACCHGIRADDLRKEVIKWVKAIEDDNKTSLMGFIIGKPAIIFIKRFFNLTDEDIKNG